MNLKLLLTPFSLLIWYCIIYYVFYFSFVSTLFVFHLNWIWVLLVSLIMTTIYVMYVNVFIGAIGKLIKSFYDNFWISLLHTVIGLLAYLMCIKTIYLDSPDNYIKIFWNESVFKTFIIAVPIFTIHVTNFLINFLFVIDDEK